MDAIYDFIKYCQANWEVITASILAVIATADKVALVALKTVRNIMDAWSETFHQ